MKYATDANISTSASKNEHNSSDSFDYLLGMPLYSLTKEKVEDLRSKISTKQDEVIKLEKATIEQLWLSDLDRLEIMYRKDLETRGYSANGS